MLGFMASLYWPQGDRKIPCNLLFPRLGFSPSVSSYGPGAMRLGRLSWSSDQNSMLPLEGARV